MDTLTIVFICAGLVCLMLFRNRIGFPSSHTLLPYQGGVLYRHGRPVREVGPGRHRVRLGLERIIFLDMRPIQVSVENRAVTLSNGATAVYGFAASAEVCDAKKALYACATYSKFPAFVTLCTTRAVLNGCTTNQITAKREALTEEIVSRCGSRLAAAGYKLMTFRFIQLEIASPGPQED